MRTWRSAPDGATWFSGLSIFYVHRIVIGPSPLYRYFLYSFFLLYKPSFPHGTRKNPGFRSIDAQWLCFPYLFLSSILCKSFLLFLVADYRILESSTSWTGPGWNLNCSRSKNSEKSRQDPSFPPLLRILQYPPSFLQDFPKNTIFFQLLVNLLHENGSAHVISPSILRSSPFPPLLFPSPSPPGHFLSTQKKEYSAKICQIKSSISHRLY